MVQARWWSSSMSWPRKGLIRDEDIPSEALLLHAHCQHRLDQDMGNTLMSTNEIKIDRSKIELALNLAVVNGRIKPEEVDVHRKMITEFLHTRIELEAAKALGDRDGRPAGIVMGYEVAAMFMGGDLWILM